MASQESETKANRDQTEQTLPHAPAAKRWQKLFEAAAKQDIAGQV